MKPAFSTMRIELTGRFNNSFSLLQKPITKEAVSASLAVEFHEKKSTMKVLVKSAWGSDDPTKAAFPRLCASPAILVQLIEWADKLLTE